MLPLRQQNTLWGLLCIQQCASPRQWQKWEIEFAEQIATHLSVALQQAKLLQQTQTAKQEADNASQAKSEFLATMSHELRTPLNAILGFSQLMGRDTSLTTFQKETLNTINQSGGHLLNLITDILDMAKIEAGKIVLNLVSCDLHQLIDKLMRMFLLKADSKGLQLTIESSPNLPEWIRTDPDKLRQILTNLLSNAIKFTPQGGVHLKVSYGEASSTLVFDVYDTGRGISEEALKGIFNPFVQAGQPNQQGTGLGLAISQKFAELLEGTLDIKSTVNQGTQVRLSIPAVRTSPPVSASLNQLTQVKYLAAGQLPIRILVVEDNAQNRCLLVHLLEAVGFQVRAAENGAKGVDLWQSWQPDLTIMDLRMPVMDGVEAAREIQRRCEQQPGKVEPVLLALSASAFEDKRKETIAAGFNAFMSKPFEAEALYQKIRQLIGVEYEYEAASHALQASDVAMSHSLCRDNINQHAQLLAQQLDLAQLQIVHHRARALDEDGLYQLCNQLQGSAPSLAQAIKADLKRLNFSTIITLIEIAIPMAQR